MNSMKTTVDIPEDELKEAMKHTGASTKREAIVTAIVEFNRRRRAERLAAKLGTLEGFPTPAELQRQRRSEG